MKRRFLTLLLAASCMLSMASCAGNAVRPDADLLYPNELYSYEEANPPEFDTYCPYSAEYLAELRDTYDLDGLTGDCETDFERVQTVTEWVTNLWDHDGMNVPPKGDPLSILHDVTAEGARYRCVEYGTVIFGCLNALGIPARTIGLKTMDVETRPYGAGHVAAEAYLKDVRKWIFIDGQWGTIPMLGETPINAVQLGGVLQNPRDYEQPLEFLTFHAGANEGYAEWIKEYLYYMDVSCYTEGADGLERRGLMLTPSEAKEPTVFQIEYPLEVDEYTHFVARFYATPEKNNR